MALPGTTPGSDISNLIPDAYAALNVVSRELVGFIPSVQRDSSADRLALGANLRSAVPPVNTAGLDIVPAMAFPSAANQAIANITFTIQKARAFPFSWSGEQQYSANTGPGYLTVNQQQIAQAIRAAAKEIDTDLANCAAANGTRAYGTAGTTPFASNLSQLAQVRKILDDNGAPSSDRQLVISTAAGANLRSLTQLTNYLNAGSTDPVRKGELLNLFDFSIKESSQVAVSTAGTSTTANVNANGYAIGVTSLGLSATGTGTIVAGDLITFAGDANNTYIATSNIANVGAGGTLTIASPGLRVALTAANQLITIGAAATRNVAFSRDALLLGTRLPIAPNPRDLAIIREVITDPMTGLSFELAAFPGNRMVTFQIGICWGVQCENPEHLAQLLG